MYSYLKNKQRKLFVKEKISSGTVTSKDALSLLHKWFRLSGVNMIIERNKYAYFLYTVLYFAIVDIYLPVSFAVSYFKSDNWDYFTLLTSVQVFINCVASSAKVTALIFLTPKLLSTEEVLAKLDARCVAEDEVQLLHKMKKLGRNLMIVFSCTDISYSICTCATAIISGHPPYGIYIPFIFWKNSKWEFLVASFIEWIIMNAVCFQEVANDAYAIAYVCVIRTHLNILCLRVKKLCKDHEKTLIENDKELKMCIKDHKNIIKLYEIVSPVISITIFIQYTITALILGIGLINIVLFSTNFSTILASCSFIVAICGETFPLCYLCTCLLSDIDKLSDHIFYSTWIHQSPSYRKMTRFFLQRAQQPMEFTAGKIYPINLASFISIAKFSFSLYTFIKQMDIKAKLGAN